MYVGGGGGIYFLLAVNSWPDLLGRDPDSTEEWMMFNEQFRERRRSNALCCM